MVFQLICPYATDTSPDLAEWCRGSAPSDELSTLALIPYLTVNCQIAGASGQLINLFIRMQPVLLDCIIF